MLSVEHITTGYGKKQVLTDISFKVGQGDIVLLTGGNGSGKSTLLKTIYGLLNPWTPEGKIIFDGKDITALPASEMIRRGMVYIPQKKNVFDDFTVEENLLTSAGIYTKLDAKERIKMVFELLPKLKTLCKRTPFHLSGGEKQLLAFGIALVHSPKLMLLDEPFAGVDAEYSAIIVDCLKMLQQYGAIFVIVEHKKQLFDVFCYKEIHLQLGITNEKNNE